MSGAVIVDDLRENARVSIKKELSRHRIIVRIVAGVVRAPRKASVGISTECTSKRLMANSTAVDHDSISSAVMAIFPCFRHIIGSDSPSLAFHIQLVPAKGMYILSADKSDKWF